MRTFATHLGNGPVAQLNRASDYGSEGYRFESCRDHKLGCVILIQPNLFYKGLRHSNIRFQACLLKHT